MANEVRILHLFGRMDRGGAELRTIDLMRHIDRSKYQFHFCSLSGQSGRLDDTIKALGGEVHLIPIYDVRFPWRFLQLLRQYHFDIVYSHVHYPSGFLLWLAALAHIPKRITHFRNSADGRSNNLWHQFERGVLCKLIDHYSTHILAVSQAAMLEAWNPHWNADSRCQVIYNGIDLCQFKAIEQKQGVCEEFDIPEHAHLYIHVGRMDVAKNHVRLLAIFTKIASEDQLAYLLMIGRGGNEIEKKLRAAISQAGLERRVIFTGVRSDVPRLLKAADLMLFPSLYEGLPGVVLEAAVCGLPVLASDLGVIREIATQLPLVHALSLAASDDEWCAVAQKLRESYALETLRNAAADAFVHSSFTMPACVQAHYKIWQD